MIESKKAPVQLQNEKWFFKYFIIVDSNLPPTTSLCIIICNAEIEIHLLKITTFESVWSNFDLYISTYVYIL